MPSKILITGGDGFIGSYVTERFNKEDFDITVVGRKPKPENINHLLTGGKIKYISGDIRDLNFCKNVVKNCEYVIHLAGLASVPQSVQDPRIFWETNVQGTANLLEAAREHKVKRFHFMSSSEILGNIPAPKKAGENSPVSIPRSPYAASKFSAEAYCNSYYLTYNLPIVITRSFNVFGPRQASGMIPGFITKILSEKPILIDGDGEQIRDLTYATDIAEGVYRAVTSRTFELEEEKEIKAPLFHLASGTERKVKDIAYKLVELTEKQGKISVEFNKDRPAQLFRSIGDPSKAEKMLGWKPKVGFEDGLKMTTEYFRKKQIPA